MPRSRLTIWLICNGGTPIYRKTGKDYIVPMNEEVRSVMLALRRKAAAGTECGHRAREAVEAARMSRTEPVCHNPATKENSQPQRLAVSS